MGIHGRNMLILSQENPKRLHGEFLYNMVYERWVGFRCWRVKKKYIFQEDVEVWKILHVGHEQ